MAVNAPAPSLLPLKKAVDVLLMGGALKKEQHDAVIKHIQRMKQRSEEAILELGLMSEQDMLKALASLYKTRFITAEKLAKAEIPRTTLDLVPRKVAERFMMVPVLFDAENNLLSVVTADPDNLETMHEVALVSGAREVRPILARPLAVRALYAKHYNGESHAFAALDPQMQTGMRQLGDGEIMVRERLVGQGDITSPRPKPAAAPPPPPPVAIPAPAPPANPLPTTTPSNAPPGMFSGEAMLEMLNVFVSLLENGRNDLRGHSALVARLARRLAERMNLAKETTLACCAAAFIHDLGKMGQFHLTALNSSEYEGHKGAAQKAHDTPVRLLEAVRLPPDAIKGVLHMYERYDGGGFPDGLAGKEIPVAARILAIADTYADLTQNSRNPYRKTLPPAEAFEVLDGFRDGLFDPHLLDLFRTMLMGEDVKNKLLANRAVALIVDADPEETTVLELRMIEQGFEVKIARTIADALRVLGQGDVDLVVSEVDLPQGDGLALLAEARRQPWGKDLPWVMHTRKQGRSEAQRAFDLGVLDYASKLSPTDVLVAKLKALLAQRATTQRGVAGSLREMGLPDLVQVLVHARKTGSLKIRNEGEAGEVHFEYGAVVNAHFGPQRGTDAFYSMLKLKEGDFGFDPTFVPTSRVIHESSETLLLEGMRRLDEDIG